YKLRRKASSFGKLRQKETRRKQFVLFVPCKIAKHVVTTFFWDIFRKCLDQRSREKDATDRDPSTAARPTMFARQRSRATPTTVDDSTVRHPSDSFETPNSTINCPRRKVFGIEKVSAKLLPSTRTDIQISVGHTERIPIERVLNAPFTRL
ncbi:Uncharacterized protein DBV15_08777, partial [Temnothorax longispinosus]